MMEILAPAGNFDILKTAVSAGADSVYFGGTFFNARRNAGNFSDEELKDAVDYCHIRGVKAYFTLNTLMFQNEIDSVSRYICILAEAGFDALIIQDMGIYRLLREICPQMPIHASTQMSAHSVSDCRALEDLGFRRVVLARELSREEMIRIKEQTSIELEVFVHGALCMSVSGQCYFSSALGERSGNRGLCAQVCRLPFYVKDRQRYNLSLKDSSLLDELQELNTIGIVSAKIEGRMKQAEYVDAAVRSATAALNGEPFDKQYLREVFSRGGFTKGYYESELGSSMFGVRTKEDKVISSNVQNAEKYDHGKVNVTLSYKARYDQPFRLSVNDRDDNTVSVEGERMQLAQNRSLSEHDVEVQISKLGDTAYITEQIHGVMDSGLFLSKSELNRVRREACSELDRIRSDWNHYHCYAPKEIKIVKKGHGSHQEPKRIVRYFSKDQLDERIMNDADLIFVPLVQLKTIGAEIIEKYQDKLGVELPRIFLGDEIQIEHDLKRLKQKGIKIAMAHTVGRVRIASELGFNIYGGFGLNIMNEQALLQYRDYDISHAVLSPEVNLNQLKSIDVQLPIGIISYGRLPLMVSRNCPVRIESGCEKKGRCILTDRKGVTFPVLCGDGVTEILNTEPIYYGDKPERISWLDFHLIYFTNETAEQCWSVWNDILMQKEHSQITRGAYFRKIT